MAEFKDRLKELRKSRDLSQAELAEKIGVSVTLSECMKTDREILQRKKWKLSQIFSM